MKKIVINNCFGGFSVSPEIAIELFKIENKLEKVFIYSSINEGECDSIMYDYARIDNVSFDKFGRFKNDMLMNFEVYLSSENIGTFIKHNQLKNTVSKYLLTAMQEIDRENIHLIDMIAKFGVDRCSGEYSNLKVVEIPSDIEYQIEDCDGNEWIAEKHRIWE